MGIALRRVTGLCKHSPRTGTLFSLLGGGSIRSIFLRKLIYSSTSIFFNSLRTGVGHAILFILGSTSRTNCFCRSLARVLKRRDIFFFPSDCQHTVGCNRQSTTGRVLEARILTQLSTNGRVCVISCPSTLTRLIISGRVLSREVLGLTIKRRVTRMSVIRRLHSFKLRRASCICRPKRFTIHKDVLSICSCDYRCPFHVSFFNSRVSAVHAFGVRSRLSGSGHSTVRVIPRLTTRRDIGRYFLRFLSTSTLIIVGSCALLRSHVRRVCGSNFSARDLARRLRNTARVRTRGVEERVGTRLGLISTSSFRRTLIRRIHVRFNGRSRNSITEGRRRLLATGNSGRTLVTFSVTPRPLFRGGFGLLTRALRSCRLRNCALCVLTSDRGRRRQLGSVFSDRRLGECRIHFAPMSGAVRRKFISRRGRTYFFASRRVFSQFRGCGLHSSSTETKGVTLAVGRLRRVSCNSFVIRISCNVKGFNKLIHIPANSDCRRVVHVICGGGSGISIDVRSLCGVDGCHEDSANRPPHLSALKANT